MPKKLVCVAPRKLEFHEYADPKLKAGEFRVRAEFGAAKHGTELSGYKGYGFERGRYDRELQVFKTENTNPAGGYPFSLGNMVVGSVAEVGPEVTKFAVGERVLCYGGFAQTHMKNENGGIFEGAWKLPKNVPWQSAVCMDPLDFAVGAVRDGNIRVGDAVAVLGLGAIGLLCIQVAKLSGAHPIIAVDMLANRLEIAKALGADIVLDPSKCDAGIEIKKATRNRGADVVIEYSGSRQALQTSLRGVAFGGTVVAGAYPPPYTAGLDFGAESHMNIPNIVFSRACSEPNREHPRWDNTRIYDVCWRLIQEGKIAGEQIVQPVVPFSELNAEYPKIETDPATNVKLGAKF